MSKVQIGRSLLVVLVLAAAGFATREAQAQTGLQYYAVTPCRAVDTRTGFGGIVPASTERQFIMKGVCNVPASAKAVSLNVTVVLPSQDGFFALWPTGGTYPSVSTINFLANEPALANGAIVPIKNPGTPDLSTGYGTASGTGQSHLVLDVTGYFQ